MRTLKVILRDILNIDNILRMNPPQLSVKEKIKPKRKMVLFSHFRQLKRYSNLSDGSILIIALITKILSSKQSVFLIEELENSIHPKALVKLINFLRSFETEKQFILATHSLVVINSVLPNNVVVSITQKDGRCNFKNVADNKDLRKKLKAGYLEFSDYIFFGEGNEGEFEEIS